MVRWWILLALGVAAVVVGVAWYVAPPGKPHGYAGMEFSVMTPGAAARAPLLTSRGALVYQVDNDSPADKAGIHAGEVLSAIDGISINSADQAAGIVKGYRAGDRVVFTLFDETQGDIHPTKAIVDFIAQPPVTNKHSVRPPSVLAKEFFYMPSMAANAAWSPRMARGPTIRPIAMPGLGAGRCNAFAPVDWEVRGHASDDSMLHVAAPTGFQHAIFTSAKLKGRDPREFVLSLIAQNFQNNAVPMQSEPQPFGFTLFKFGIARGAAGFAEYHVTKGGSGDNRIAVWLVAVAAADAAWAVPQTGAVAFSIHCLTADAPAPRPHDPTLVPTSVSAHCIAGSCGEGDFAAQYMKVLQLGYVHDRAGATWLIKPQSDFWQNGADGPGFYHQIGGENEKLEPGRTN